MSHKVPTLDMDGHDLMAQHREPDSRDEEIRRLKADNMEWLAAARRLNNATDEAGEHAALAWIDALRIGNGDVDLPPAIRAILVDQRDEAQRDLAASRRESATLGAMVARLREALGPLWKYVRTKHGDWYMNAERREHANRIDAALALTPATVVAYLTALEAMLCFEHKGVGETWTANDRALVLAARALLSDRAPGKGNK